MSVIKLGLSHRFQTIYETYSVEFMVSSWKHKLSVCSEFVNGKEEEGGS